MKHVSYKEVPLETVSVEGAKGANIRWLVGAKDGAPNFAMRMFEIEIGGNTPYHHHSFEHEIFVLSGAGVLKTKDNVKPMNIWDVIFVNPDIEHQFINVGDEPLVFLCLVPLDEKPVPKKNPFGGGKANNC